MWPTPARAHLRSSAARTKNLRLLQWRPLPRLQPWSPAVGYNISGTERSSGILQRMWAIPAASTFTQSGGTNNILGLFNALDALHRPTTPASSGNYSLSSSGVLVAQSECVGCSSMGTLTQSGGTNNGNGNGELLPSRQRPLFAAAPVQASTTFAQDCSAGTLMNSWATGVMECLPNLAGRIALRVTVSLSLVFARVPTAATTFARGSLRRPWRMWGDSATVHSSKQVD